MPNDWRSNANASRTIGLAKGCCRFGLTCWTLQPMTTAMSRPVRQPITDRMQVLIVDWEQSGAARAIFPSCHRLMTANSLPALEAGEFLDPAWVHALLHRFADYYFGALDVYRRRAAFAPSVYHPAAKELPDAPASYLKLAVILVEHAPPLAPIFGRLPLAAFQNGRFHHRVEVKM
jgi:hypothetical protein